MRLLPGLFYGLGISLFAMPVAAEKVLIRLGKIHGIERKMLERHLTEFLNLTDPDHKKLLREWELEQEQQDAPLVLDIIAMGAAHGSAGKEGHILISSTDAANAALFMAILEHEWLGHYLNGRQETRITGQKQSHIEDELISRVRGWRLWLRLDPKAARKDEALTDFLKAGPKAYWESLVEPDRTYALALNLEELRNPEASLDGRIKKINAWLEKRRAPPPTPDWAKLLHTIAITSSALRSEKWTGTGNAPPRIIPAVKKSSLKPPQIQAKPPLKKPRDYDPMEEIERELFAEHMLDLGKRLRADSKIMAKYRLAASNPQLQALVAPWNREIMDFCNQARKELGMAGPCQP